MSVWVVVGGQYGSEGKGKIAAHLTLMEDVDLCIRCGGPNSGHSFVSNDGTSYLVRQVPTGFIRPDARLLIPAGGLIDPEVLKSEIDLLGLNERRLGIDQNTVLIESFDKQQEVALGLRERLSSTLCGVGSAVARRAMREPKVRLARDASGAIGWIQNFLTHTSGEANDAASSGRRILVEGTQGFGLSLYHSPHYPKTTSRDTTAAACISEVGLSPRWVTEIVLVLRTFPIRVAGAQAGGLEEEISWKTLQDESGYPYPIEEITSVTKVVRRIGRFEWGMAAEAVRANGPTQIAVNGLDYLDYSNRFACETSQLSAKAKEFVADLALRFGVRVSLLGRGPSLGEVIAAEHQLACS